jgi:hypothetical protein
VHVASCRVTFGECGRLSALTAGPCLRLVGFWQELQACCPTQKQILPTPVEQKFSTHMLALTEARVVAVVLTCCSMHQCTLMSMCHIKGKLRMRCCASFASTSLRCLHLHVQEQAGTAVYAAAGPEAYLCCAGLQLPWQLSRKHARHCLQET